MSSTMDFFGHQERARRKTGRLVIYFLLAVGGIVTAIYLLGMGVFVFMAASEEGPAPVVTLWEPKALVGLGFPTLLLIFGAAMFKTAQLSGGGKNVASALGGRLVQSGTRSAHERRLLNVVEEMSIATGTAVPPVYVMDQEEGINAFAAGFSTKDAVLGVTRGTLEQLDRDELQGVVAHEFSHVLNGDMRLNIRLMGVLFGITCITTCGYLIVRAFRYSRGGRKKGGQLILFGVGLMVIGWIGSLFASLIRAAVSRQREYLADASAVQFTRSPDGIGGALRKIGGFAGKSLVQHPQAAECSHMFFGSAVKRSFVQLWATHPPIESRISAIDPSFDPKRLPREVRSLVTELRAAQATGLASVASGLGGGSGGARELSMTPEQMVDSVGTPEVVHLTAAAQMLEKLDPELLKAVHDPLGARAVAYALLLHQADGDPAGEPIRRRQLELIRQQDGMALGWVEKAVERLDRVVRTERLPLLELALPELRNLSVDQYRVFSRLVDELIRADDEVDLFEFALERLLARNLRGWFEEPTRRTGKWRSLRRLSTQCRVVLSALAHAGNAEPSAAEHAFGVGADQMEWAGDKGPPGLLSRRECGVEQLGSALDEIERARPLDRKRFVQACGATVAVDGKLTAREAELLRAICDGIDCPMPPFVTA